MKGVGLTGLFLLFTLLFLPHARAESGYQVIQGTQVYTVIDHSRGVATFSNNCGSQTLTQRQLQQGAIPSQIIPCPRRGGGGSSCRSGYVPASGGCMPAGKVDCGNGTNCPGSTICVKGGCLDIMSNRVCSDIKTYCPQGYECRSGNKCVSPDAEKASEYFEDGEQKFEEKKYSDASLAFAHAAAYYGYANQTKNQQVAKKNEALADCYSTAEIWEDSADLLRQLAAKEDCQQFPNFAASLRQKADNIENREKEAERKRTAIPPARTPPSSASQQRTACNTGGSTVTGLGTDTPKAEDKKLCNQADFLLRTARRMRRDVNSTPQQADAMYRNVAEALRQAGDLAAAQRVEKEMVTPLPSLVAENPVWGKTQGDQMYRVAGIIMENALKEVDPKERVSMLEHAASRFDDAAQYYHDDKDKEGERRALQRKAEALALAEAAAKAPPEEKEKDLEKEKCDAIKKQLDILKAANVKDTASIIQTLEAKLKLLDCH